MLINVNLVYLFLWVALDPKTTNFVIQNGISCIQYLSKILFFHVKMNKKSGDSILWAQLLSKNNFCSLHFKLSSELFNVDGIFFFVFKWKYWIPPVYCFSIKLLIWNARPNCYEAMNLSLGFICMCNVYRIKMESNCDLISIDKRSQ